MRNLAKLFVLAMCLTLVGALWANGAKGPQVSLDTKYGVGSINLSEQRSAMEMPRHVRGTLDEVIISEDFEAVADGALPVGWTQVSVDNGFCAQFNRNSTWQAFNYGANAHGGAKVAMCHYNDAALPNNDWLILPQQNLGGQIMFSFWAASQDPNYLESFAVKLSTTGNQPANFTVTLGTYTNVPTTWQQYTYDLSQYAGAAFYVAIHYNSIDEFVLKIDDVLLEAGEAGPQGSIVGTVTEFGAGTPIQNVTVAIQGGATTTTDASGQYTFVDVPVGTYTMNFTKMGYEPETVTGVDVTEDGTTVVDVEMIFLNLVVTDYASTGGVVNIPDQNPAGAVKTLVINDDVLIEDVDVTVNITHTWVSDLDLYLVAPWADSVQLAEDPTDFPPGANMTNTRFDDEAANPFAYNSSGAPYTGSFRPFQQLSAFDGFTTMGTWGLRAVDNEQADVGTINNFTIHVTHAGTSADDAPGSVPSEFSVGAAYPNPFNPSTQISFSVPNTTNATMKIFNSLGQEVATLIDGQVVAGMHTVYFTAYNLPSGLYFAQFRAGSFTSTQKLVLMK